VRGPAFESPRVRFFIVLICWGIGLEGKRMLRAYRFVEDAFLGRYGESYYRLAHTTENDMEHMGR
jgi:hypothetical protein